MIYIKKLSLLMVVLLMLSIVAPSAAFAEILPKLSPTLTGNFTASLGVDDTFEVFLSTTPNIAANTPDTEATYDSDNDYRTVECRMMYQNYQVDLIRT